ncbi:recombination protein NinG, partial [Pseudomonas aeruginosa]|nr:recombination protein NinG [Pseudomonas aeruginosa]
MSGNAVEYRIHLIERIGLDRVERLEADNELRRFDIPYLQRIKSIFTRRARARTRTLSVEQNYDKWYDFTGEQDLPLADLDVILMRKDP